MSRVTPEDARLLYALLLVLNIPRQAVRSNPHGVKIWQFPQALDKSLRRTGSPVWVAMVFYSTV